MEKPILVVGGGPAGLAAAHALGGLKRQCILVEKEDRLGGAPILSGYHKLVPSGEYAKDAIGGMVAGDVGGVFIVVMKACGRIDREGGLLPRDEVDRASRRAIHDVGHADHEDQ